MQITFLFTAVGNSIQHAVFEIVSVSTHLRVGEIEVAESVGLPHPLATASSPSQAVPASEWLGKHTGLMFSVKFTAKGKWTRARSLCRLNWLQPG